VVWNINKWNFKGFSYPEKDVYVYMHGTYGQMQYQELHIIYRKHGSVLDLMRPISVDQGQGMLLPCGRNLEVCQTTCLRDDPSDKPCVLSQLSSVAWLMWVLRVGYIMYMLNWFWIQYLLFIMWYCKIFSWQRFFESEHSKIDSWSYLGHHVFFPNSIGQSSPVRLWRTFLNSQSMVSYR